MPKLLPLLTLNLTGYRVKVPDSKTEDDFQDPKDYIVSTRLVADRLDDSGFVTDNGLFIEEVQYYGEFETPQDVANYAVRQARDDIGDRLVLVDAVVKDGTTWETLSADAWKNPQRTPPQNCHSLKQSKVAKNDVMIPVNLVDIAVCGGYDGRFRCDIAMTVGNKDTLHINQLIDRATKAFNGGPFKASCEELAGAMIYVAVQLFEDRVHKMSTRVYNKTGFAECDYELGWQVPPFARLATAREIEESNARKGTGTPKSC